MKHVDPRRPSPTRPMPHGLWSLWDMLELKAGAFIEAATNLAGTASYIGGTSVEQPNVEKKIFHKDTPLDEPDRAYLRGRLRKILEHLETLGADVTAISAADADKHIGQPWARFGTARTAFDEICHTLQRELSLKTVLVLQSQESHYYAPKVPLFGQSFADRFKKAGIFELDEAGKCFALGRPTAAVFHLMRILEIGIRALADCLQIPDPVKPAERNWSVILRQIKDGIEQKWPRANDRMDGDGLLFDALYASLDAVKNPWRNETMHVAAKYTDDEARHVFVAVEGFMKKLSSRMDEDGKPLA